MCTKVKRTNVSAIYALNLRGTLNSVATTSNMLNIDREKSPTNNTSATVKDSYRQIREKLEQTMHKKNTKLSRKQIYNEE